MNKFVYDLESFKKYIQDSSVAIFTEETNKAHDWNRKIRCTVDTGHSKHYVVIKETAAEGLKDSENFCFVFELEFSASIDKDEARKIINGVAKEMQFHPNIKVCDCTEHSDGRKLDKSTGNDRYFWLAPKGFKPNTELQRYCWEGVPERAVQWTASMFVEVKLTPGDLWGRSFDLGEESLEPADLLRKAIKDRDEKILAEEIRKKAKEKEEQERITFLKENMKKYFEEVQQFLDGISDFVLTDSNGDTKNIRECIETINTEHPVFDARLNEGTVRGPIKEHEFHLCGPDGHNLLLEVVEIDGEVGYHDDWNGCILSIEEIKKGIIQWALENGVKDPEASLVG